MPFFHISIYQDSREKPNVRDAYSLELDLILFTSSSQHWSSTINPASFSCFFEMPFRLMYLSLRRTQKDSSCQSKRTSEKIKLIQIGIQYITPNSQIEEQEQQMFQIDIIDSLSKN